MDQKINRSDFVSKLIFMARVQEMITTDQRNAGMPDFKISEILSSFLLSSVVVLYQSRYPDSNEISHPDQGHMIHAWSELVQDALNKMNINIHEIRKDYPGFLSVGKVQLEVICSMENLADALIKSNEKNVRLSRGQADGSGLKGD